jgi:uridylate kinase
VKTILIKLSGELFSYCNNPDCATTITEIANQIKKLQKDNIIGLVIGGGSFFRGASDGKRYNIRPTTAHHVGMLATLMNGLILHDVLKQHGIDSLHLSSLRCPTVASSVTQQLVEHAIEKKQCIVFSGGTGNPFVTTDTNAIVKALYIGADEVWKATKVDGIYDSDPEKNPNSNFIKEISYHDAVTQNLQFMDSTALTLAHQHDITIRFFNLFKPNALLNAYENKEFGSTICRAK